MNIKNYSFIFIALILLISLLIIGINSTYSRKIWNEDMSNKLNNLLYNITNIINKMSDQYRIIEYPLILLFCIVGGTFLILSSDLISVFLSIELQSYSLYLIASIYRNSESSITAGLTYFLLGGLSSCIILLGICLIYINFGNTSLENIYIINNISSSLKYNLYSYVTDTFSLNSTYIYSYIFTQYNYLQITLVIISIGLLFKIASAPFHFWSPDVYDAIPTIVTTFVAIIPKISLLVFLYEISYFTDNDSLMGWSNNIMISCILSFIIGSVLGLTQYRIKRLFAYSTISHIGFMLLGLCLNNLESARALFFYIIQYSISNLNAFIILIVIGNSLYSYSSSDLNLKDRKYSPIQLISQLKGYFHINPLLSVSLSLTLFSFVGIPPLIGFFGKQMILAAAINKGYILTIFIAIITSVISAIYYLVIVKNIFFETSQFKLNTSLYNNIKKNINMYLMNNNKTITPNNIIISSYLSSVISIITLIITIFMFFDQELIRLIYVITL
jgi:NADH-ubiquinone oxidoreductase chain 2